jgi:hydroxymethylbilane synthase
VETRLEDRAANRLVEPLKDEPTEREVEAERAFLARLGGGCLAPATAHARLGADEVVVEAVVGDPDGKRLLRDRIVGRRGDESRLGDALAVRLLESGGEEILRASRQDEGE